MVAAAVSKHGQPLRWLLAAALLAVVGLGSARAEPDASEYQVPEGASSKRERESARAQIRRDVEREALRAAEQAAQETRRTAEARLAAAARPIGERLLEQHCAQCHRPDNYLGKRHTPLGWHLVLWRMRLLNGAPLAWGEQRVIAAELVRLGSPAPSVVAYEYGAAAGALLAPLALVGWAVARRRRRRGGGRTRWHEA